MKAWACDAASQTARPKIKTTERIDMIAVLATFGIHSSKTYHAILIAGKKTAKRWVVVFMITIADETWNIVTIFLEVNQEGQSLISSLEKLVGSIIGLSPPSAGFQLCPPMRRCTGTTRSGIAARFASSQAPLHGKRRILRRHRVTNCG